MNDTDVFRGATVVYLVTEDWYFCSHRLPIARAARNAGARVIVATRVAEHGARIREEGFDLVELPWTRRFASVADELRAFARIVRLYRRERPAVVHHVAMKPALYGGVAAGLARCRCQVHAIAGFGYVATSRQRRASLLRPWVRSVLRGILRRDVSNVIVQNPDDERSLVQSRMCAPDRVHVIRGSGVDVRRFEPLPEPGGVVVAALVARMLTSKGIVEFAEAARILRRRNLPVRMRLVGSPDRENPEAVTESTLEGWVAEGIVEWTRHVEDVRDVWRDAHIAVLPSYREGLPKSLLEAAACSRAIVATDVPGCREIVASGDNGTLVPVRDAGALADAIAGIAADAPRRLRMGKRGRERAVSEFSEDIVVSATLALYVRLLSKAGTS